MRPRRRPMLGLAALALGAAGGACSSIDAKVHNLREVHHPDGSTKRVGDVVSDVQYEMRRLFGGLELLGLDPRSVEPEPIDDPLAVAVENLVELGAFEPDERRVGGLQVEMATWLAVDDRWMLARERSAILLGEAARRLGVRAFAPFPPDAPAADAEAVREALRGVVHALWPVFEELRDQDAFAPRFVFLPGAEPELGTPPPAAPPPLEGACDAVAALPLDREGARRVLAVLNQLVDLGEESARLSPLHDLHRELERRCVAMTLPLCLDDPHPRVRKAALRAIVVATRNRRPDLLRDALADPDDEVVREALRLLAEWGFPIVTEDAAEAERERFDWIARMVRMSRDPIGPIAVGACQVLGRHARAGFATLRGEEWTSWWQRRAQEALPPPPPDA